MSSFDMNDLLLVPPSSPIRFCQVVSSPIGTTSWSDGVVNYINNLNTELYGCCCETNTLNRIATTTAIMINELLVSSDVTPFYCVKSVQRGSDTITELEIALPNCSFENILSFHKELVEAVLNDSVEYNVIPTHFSWAEAAVAFRYRDMKFGAIGYVNRDLLRINPVFNDAISNCCIMGVPLKTFSQLLKGAKDA